MKVLLIDPARKCVSAVTGVFASRSAKPTPPAHSTPPQPHQRDPGARHAGVVQHLLHGGLELVDRPRVGIVSRRLRRHSRAGRRQQCPNDNSENGTHPEKKLYSSGGHCFSGFSEGAIGTAALRVELDTDRKIRTRNKLYYRFNHWPIWIFVFFIAPGPLTFDLFERGFDQRLLTWLGIVLAGTGIAGLFGKLPGCEPAPYIIRFTEDRPNPLYRRICYTTAWGEVVAFAVLNAAGLLYAIVTGEWQLKQMYESFYFPIAGTMWVLGACGLLPRVKPSTKGEGHERRYFYGSVWAVTIAQPVLWFMWRALPRSTTLDVVKLARLHRHSRVCRKSRAPGSSRTRPIVPGELAVSD